MKSLVAKHTAPQKNIKIVVNENSFDWYLHFSGDDKTPKTCNVEGDKKAHKIELFGASYALALVEGCSGCYRRGWEIILTA